jgi:hypothetical protein
VSPDPASLLTVVLAILVAVLLGPRLFGLGRGILGSVRRANRNQDFAPPDAEQRAEQLLRSVVGEDGWQAWRALGFLYAFGPGEEDGQPGYGYLIYPHRPMVSFDARSGRLLNELCVRFPDLEEERGLGAGERLPDADDVLAKWMAVRGDELGLLAEANLLPPGQQIDPDQARRDIVRLAEWTALPAADPAAS